MFKKLQMMMLVGGVGMMVLAGMYSKSSRRFIEGKAAGIKQGPTPTKMEDLFDKFRRASQIRITDTEQKMKNSPSLNQEITLSGIPETKEKRKSYQVDLKAR